ncbi:hypothetical protein NDU88_006860 [Pleurodeles waltl]|uniref:Uncharacterized protein n=1 Tax=Pleurodeles waltl TaxID=8319 RepID=A0AAV7RP90_PLEWA|nr:hypothetical protein NDU88_006860 [Pleurodeles waltl]
MAQDEQVRAALALLRQAGRLDLVKEEALAPGHPARRASAGVAAAVVACSPPRAGAASLQVRRGGKGVGGPSKVGKAAEGQRRDVKRNGRGRGPRASPGAGRPRAAPRQRDLGRTGKGAPLVARSPGKAGVLRSKGKAGGPKACGFAEGEVAGKGLNRGFFLLGSSEPDASRRDITAVSEGDGGESTVGGAQGTKDPRVPVSVKWPTMLQWSSSEEEGDYELAVSEEECIGGPPGRYALYMCSDLNKRQRPIQPTAV